MTTGRNDPCRCGSGKRDKRCCLQVEHFAAPFGLVEVEAVDRRRMGREYRVTPSPLLFDAVRIGPQVPKRLG